MAAPLRVTLATVSHGTYEYAGPDCTVAQLVEAGCARLNMNKATTLCVSGGRVLPGTARLSEANVSDGATVLLLASTKPLFDASQVSGLLAQLQLQTASPAMAALREMGFAPLRAELALLLHGQNQDAALNWLVEHADEPDPPEALQRCIARRQCTFTVTGTQYQPQRYFECRSCGTSHGEGVCEACRIACHADCDVSESIWSDGFFCDCGSNSRFQRRCKCNAKIN